MNTRNTLRLDPAGTVASISANQAPDPEASPGRIRPLRRSDLPEIVALRREIFHRSERPDDDDLVAYLERVFLQSPWRGEEVLSLVYEDATCRVSGFLGVMPRIMMLRGEPLRVAVGTQLMVSPAHRGLVGLRLVRAYREGPYDLCLSDAANDAARRLWQSVGGVVAPAYGVGWERVLRPLWRHLEGRPGATFARSLGAAVTTVLRKPAWRRRAPAGALTPLDPATMAAAAPLLLQDYALRPCYEDDSFPWLLEQLAEKREFGALEGALLRDGDAVAGWFLYCLAPSGNALVVQLVARPADRERVVQHLSLHAWRRGAHTLNGRLSPDWLPALAAGRCGLRADAPCVLYWSSRLDVLRAIERGDVFLSRLDGEWWLSF